MITLNHNANNSGNKITLGSIFSQINEGVNFTKLSKPKNPKIYPLSIKDSKLPKISTQFRKVKIQGDHISIDGDIPNLDAISKIPIITKLFYKPHPKIGEVTKPIGHPEVSPYIGFPIPDTLGVPASNTDSKATWVDSAAKCHRVPVKYSPQNKTKTENKNVSLLLRGLLYEYERNQEHYEKIIKNIIHEAKLPEDIVRDIFEAYKETGKVVITVDENEGFYSSKVLDRLQTFAERFMFTTKYSRYGMAKFSIDKSWKEYSGKGKSALIGMEKMRFNKNCFLTQLGNERYVQQFSKDVNTRYDTLSKLATKKLNKNIIIESAFGHTDELSRYLYRILNQMTIKQITAAGFEEKVDKLFDYFPIDVVHRKNLHKLIWEMGRKVKEMECIKLDCVLNFIVNKIITVEYDGDLVKDDFWMGNLTFTSAELSVFADEQRSTFKTLTFADSYKYLVDNNLITNDDTFRLLFWRYGFLDKSLFEDGISTASLLSISTLMDNIPYRLMLPMEQLIKYVVGCSYRLAPSAFCLNKMAYEFREKGNKVSYCLQNDLIHRNLPSDQLAYRISSVIGADFPELVTVEDKNFLRKLQKSLSEQHSTTSLGYKMTLEDVLSLHKFCGLEHQDFILLMNRNLIDELTVEKFRLIINLATLSDLENHTLNTKREFVHVLNNFNPANYLINQINVMMTLEKAVEELDYRCKSIWKNIDYVIIDHLFSTVKHSKFDLTKYKYCIPRHNDFPISHLSRFIETFHLSIYDIYTLIRKKGIITWDTYSDIFKRYPLRKITFSLLKQKSIRQKFVSQTSIRDLLVKNKGKIRKLNKLSGLFHEVQRVIDSAMRKDMTVNHIKDIVTSSDNVEIFLDDYVDRQEIPQELFHLYCAHSTLLYGPTHNLEATPKVLIKNKGEPFDYQKLMLFFFKEEFIYLREMTQDELYYNHDEVMQIFNKLVPDLYKGSSILKQLSLHDVYIPVGKAIEVMKVFPKEDINEVIQGLEENEHFTVIQRKNIIKVIDNQIEQKTIHSLSTYDSHTAGRVVSIDKLLLRLELLQFNFSLPVGYSYSIFKEQLLSKLKQSFDKKFNITLDVIKKGEPGFVAHTGNDLEAIPTDISPKRFMILEKIAMTRLYKCNVTLRDIESFQMKYGFSPFELRSLLSFVATNMKSPISNLSMPSYINAAYESM